MNRTFSISAVVIISVVVVTFGDRLQCKDPNGQPVDWFAAIKLPNLRSTVSDGTVYVYLDAKNPEWTVLTGITTKKSAIGETVSQIYAPTEKYNNSIAWIVYNDAPTNINWTAILGHSKGMVAANKNSGFWLVHSVPHFPYLPYQSNNSYAYPKTGVKFGQSFLCMSMVPNELDKVGSQLINNEVLVYGSHFGDNLKTVYPGLYNSTLPRGQPSTNNDGVRLQHLQSIDGFKFFSVSKNRNFDKDLYGDLITNLTQSSIYTETWLNMPNSFNSSCSGQYRVMNIRGLTMKSIKGLQTCTFDSAIDHSKWVITGKSTIPWICIGDINRAEDQITRGGGTVCIDSIKIWNEYKKLVLNIEKCEL